MIEPAFIVPQVARLPVSTTVNALPADDVIIFVEALSLIVALPLVETLNELAFVLAILMSPLPELSVNVPVVMALPLADWVIAPEPSALKVVFVALRFPLMNRFPFEPALLPNEIFPTAVIPPVVRSLPD